MIFSFYHSSDKSQAMSLTLNRNQQLDRRRRGKSKAIPNQPSWSKPKHRERVDVGNRRKVVCLVAMTTGALAPFVVLVRMDPGLDPAARSASRFDPSAAPSADDRSLRSGPPQSTLTGHPQWRRLDKRPTSGGLSKRRNAAIF